jgi:hypothetical protein
MPHDDHLGETLIVPMKPTIEAKMSFERAVNLFKEWGFRVEPGPEPEEVTLWVDTPGHRVCSVYPAHLLPKIAAVIYQVRANRQYHLVRARRANRFGLDQFIACLINSLN